MRDESGRMDADTGILVGSGGLAQDAKAPATATTRIRVYDFVFMLGQRVMDAENSNDCKDF